MTSITCHIHWHKYSNMFRENYPTAWMFNRNTERSSTTLLNGAEPGNPEPAFKEYADGKIVKLPPPSTIENTFSELLQARKSCRLFDTTLLPLATLSTVLHYAYGIRQVTYYNNVEFLERFAPSGGGLYSLELYIIATNVENVSPGIYHYFPLDHSLETIAEIKLAEQFLTHLFLDQSYVANAGAYIIACSMIDRCMHKYEDRGYRYILLEAGHVFQNMNLCATALRAGSLNLGGFYDEDMRQLLGIDGNQEVPLYAMALGNYETPDCGDVRSI